MTKFSKRGTKALQRHAETIVKNQLRLYLRLVGQADAEAERKVSCPSCNHEFSVLVERSDAVKEAFEAGDKLMPYVRAKQLAVASGLLDDDGSVITSSKLLQLIEIARQAMDNETKLLST